MFKFGKTLLVVLGSDNETVAKYISVEMNEAEIYDILFTDQKINNLLVDYDNDPLYSDLIFITTDEQSSQLFLDNKYNEKVLFKDAVNTNALRAPSITWSNVSELPSLIKKLERNISEHANF